MWICVAGVWVGCCGHVVEGLGAVAWGWCAQGCAMAVAWLCAGFGHCICWQAWGKALGRLGAWLGAGLGHGLGQASGRLLPGLW